jgi:diacylglycerol kinase
MLKIVKSFGHAFNGLVYSVSKETNLKIEIVAGILVIAAMVMLNVQRWEAAFLVASIFAVIVLELINTLVERLVNIFRPRIHPYAGTIKDIMAAAVFVTAFGAMLIGIVIFWPYIFG